MQLLLIPTIEAPPTPDTLAARFLNVALTSPDAACLVGPSTEPSNARALPQWDYYHTRHVAHQVGALLCQAGAAASGAPAAHPMIRAAALFGRRSHYTYAAILAAWLSPCHHLAPAGRLQNGFSSSSSSSSADSGDYDNREATHSGARSSLSEQKWLAMAPLNPWLNAAQLRQILLLMKPVALVLTRLRPHQAKALLALGTACCTCSEQPDRCCSQWKMRFFDNIASWLTAVLHMSVTRA